ncbi:MAG: AraC family transcriptional regulator [Oscillospiraceae bacterium]|jgi:AraC family transcriptional regulator|nr:AraC family transcriptional regulator [Oscillospiraceae bacterium]
MEWIERLNTAINYIEEHLGGKIEYGELAKIACCSEYHFQRMFGYMAGVTLSEYIRRRRMSRAAADMQNGGKVIDIALKYGYESPTAFNRAFQNIHGIAPSNAKQNGITLKSFPPISFKITIKGVEEMNYKIEQKAAFRIVGVRETIPTDIEESFKCVPQFWQKSAPQIPQLVPLMDGEVQGLLGVSTCNEVEGEQNYYYIAVQSNAPLPENMHEFTIPAATWVIFSGSGTSADIQTLQERIVAEWLPTSGYEWANAPDIEVYLDQNPADMKFEVWLPVAKANK